MCVDDGPWLSLYVPLQFLVKPVLRISSDDIHLNTNDNVSSEGLTFACYQPWKIGEGVVSGIVSHPRQVANIEMSTHKTGYLLAHFPISMSLILIELLISYHCNFLFPHYLMCAQYITYTCTYTFMC